MLNWLTFLLHIGALVSPFMLRKVNVRKQTKHFTRLVLKATEPGLWEAQYETIFFLEIRKYGAHTPAHSKLNG